MLVMLVVLVVNFGEWRYQFEWLFKCRDGWCWWWQDLLGTLNNFMDSTPFLKFMWGGCGTFLHDGCAAFWWEAMHLSKVPMCTLRSVMEEHMMPESCEMISNLFRRQA